jgi:cation diffusion facilitator family transporter
MELRVPEGHPVAEPRVAVRAGVISLVAGIAIMGTKFAAWAVTGSTAVLADAAESVVNVVAAVLVTAGVVVASRPADADHPYGHGKAEFLSAAAEGGMIFAAATLIVVQSIREIVVGPEIQRIGAGILIAGGAGLANLALGLYLLRVGRKERSAAVTADGVHVLTDVATTVGTIVALVLVGLTGFTIIDPLAGLLIGVHILWAGWRVVRRAVGGLLDEADFELLQSIAALLARDRRSEWVEVHQLRGWSSGANTHLDLHLVVPRYLSVEAAHDLADDFEARLLQEVPDPADVIVHIDPCTPRHCSACQIENCPVRSTPLEAPFPFTVESLTRAGTI